MAKPSPTPFVPPAPDDDLLVYRVRRGYRTAIELSRAVKASTAVISRLQNGHLLFPNVVARIRDLLGLSAAQMERLILNGSKRRVR
jgi:hypothetical protein